MDNLINFSMEPEQPLMPGRLISSREPWYAPKSGKKIELISICLHEQNSVRITTQIISRHAYPPLDDGTTPESTSQIRECSDCLRIVSDFNTITCPNCGYIFCLPCTALGIFDQEQQRLCIDCDITLNGDCFDRINRWCDKLEKKVKKNALLNY